MTGAMAEKPKARASDLPKGHRCRACGSRCCRYISVAIVPPRERIDYELIRWYLTHRTACVYIDSRGDWMVQVDTTCRHLINHRCAIYDRRPKICRAYSVSSCEASDHDEENIAEFATSEEFERFFRRNFRFEGQRVRRRHRVYRTGPTSTPAGK